MDGVSAALAGASGGQLVAIIPDAHVGAGKTHDPVAVGAVRAMLARLPVDRLVVLGDWWDLEAVSAHNVGKPRKQEGQRLAADLAAGGEELTDLVAAATSLRPGTPGNFDFCEGNHEHRLGRWLDRYPEVDGALACTPRSIVTGLGGRYHDYIRHAPQCRVGKLHFLHGSYCGLSAVRKHLVEHNVNLCMGHLHRLEVITKPSAGATMMAACLGYLGKPELGHSYMDGPANWTQAFGLAIVWPGGNFNLFPVVLTKELCRRFLPQRGRA